MANTAENFNYEEKNEKDQNDLHLQNAAQMDEEQCREMIGRMAGNAYMKGYIDDKARQEYMQVAQKKEAVPLKTEMLRSILETAQGHFRKADELDKILDDAVKKGIATEDDKKYLIQAAQQKDFAANPDKIIKEKIKPKIERMQERKDWYVKMSNHPCVEKGKIKMGKDTMTYNIKSENEFMKMKPKEKEAELARMKGAILKAKAYFKGMDDDYLDLLKKEKAKGNIGKKTYDEFEEEFTGLKTISEKEHYIKEFPNQMKDRRHLWTLIKNTFKEGSEERKHLESMRDKLGYHDMLAEYTKMPDKMNERYSKDLDSFQQKGYINTHTKNEFNTWMEAQTVSKKYEAFEKLHDRDETGEMYRYKVLQQHVEDNLTPEQQGVINLHDHDWGYTEIEDYYKKQMGIDSSGIKGVSPEMEEAEKKLNGAITSGTLAKGAKKMVDDVAEGWGGAGLDNVEQMFKEQSESTSTETHDVDYQSQLAQARQKMELEKQGKKEYESVKDAQREDSASDAAGDIQSQMFMKRRAAQLKEEKRMQMEDETENEEEKKPGLINRFFGRKEPDKTEKVTKGKDIDIEGVERETKKLELYGAKVTRIKNEFEEVNIDGERHAKVKIATGSDDAGSKEGLEAMMERNQREKYRVRDKKDTLTIVTGEAGASNEQQFERKHFEAMAVYAQAKREEFKRLAKAS